MKQRMIYGVFLFIVSLSLVTLFSVKLRFSKTSFLLDTTFEISPNGEANNFYNVTFTPLSRDDYRIEVRVSPYYMIDFWAVNETGLGMLSDFLSWGDLFKPDYPDKPPFNVIKTYAKEINITAPKRIELINLTSNDVCCLVLMNFFDDPQIVSTRVEEHYLEPPRTLLESSSTNIAIAGGTFVFGTYLIITSRKRTPKRAKKHTVYR
jgi:hypothetical protein